MYVRNNPARIVACMHVAVLNAFGNVHVCKGVHKTVLSHVGTERRSSVSSILVLYVRQPPNDLLAKKHVSVYIVLCV